MDWFAHDFDHPLYFTIYADKAVDAPEEGPALVKLLNLPPGSRVLDLPCGWGRLHPYLRDRGLQIIGGDLSPLNLAKHQANHPTPLVRLDFRALPFRAASADGVFCAFTSWGYFATEAENLRQLTEFARVLQPGGVLLLDLTGRASLWSAVIGVEGHWMEYAKEGYVERTRWSPDKARVITERVCQGEPFCHDIWIPTDTEVRDCLQRAGFQVEQAYGGLDGRPWGEREDRWIYRCIKR